MEQSAQYLTWMRRELLLSKSSAHHLHSWEERAFAEDAAGGLGGCVWPPRSYSCSFCRREFRSAQALGGHMNVHRRDRARLKQSLIIRSSVQEEEEEEEEEEDAGGLEQFQSTERICQVIVSNNGNNIVSKDKDDHDQKKMIKVDDDDVDCVETNLSVGWSTNRTGLGCGSEKAFRFSKRPRTGNLNQLPPPFAPADSTKAVPFVGVQATAKGMELDLELRLAW